MESVSLLFGELRLLSFGVFVFWHDGANHHSSWRQRGEYWYGIGFEVVIVTVDDERGSSPETIYAREGAQVYTMNLEVKV